MVTSISPTYGGYSRPCHLGTSEVICGTRPLGVRRCKLCVHKIQTDPADIGAGLGEGVLAGPRRGVEGRIARVGDVGQVELEITRRAICLIDGATRTKS